VQINLIGARLAGAALQRVGQVTRAESDQLPARVKRWRLHLPDRHRARLTGPGRAVIYDGDCEQPGDWAELIAGTGSCVILVGTIGLYASGAAPITAGRLTAMLDARRACRCTGRRSRAGPAPVN
jgi:hypothetical protein